MWGVLLFFFFECETNNSHHVKGKEKKMMWPIIVKKTKFCLADDCPRLVPHSAVVSIFLSEFKVLYVSERKPLRSRNITVSSE